MEIKRGCYSEYAQSHIMAIKSQFLLLILCSCGTYIKLLFTSQVIYVEIVWVFTVCSVLNLAFRHLRLICGPGVFDLHSYLRH